MAEEDREPFQLYATHDKTAHTIKVWWLPVAREGSGFVNAPPPRTGLWIFPSPWGGSTLLFWEVTFLLIKYLYFYL